MLQHIATELGVFVSTRPRTVYVALAITLLLLLDGRAWAAPFESTTKGRIVLTCDGAKVSEHSVETEATASAITYAISKAGKASCVLTYPPKTLAIALSLAAATPVPPPTPPAPTSGSATLSWMPVTHNEDGSALTNLAGYRVHYGNSASALTLSMDVGVVNAFTINNLAPGTWYFAVRAITAKGAESILSPLASKTIG